MKKYTKKVQNEPFFDYNSVSRQIKLAKIEILCYNIATFSEGGINMNKITRYTKRILLVLISAALGYSNMLFAIFADVGVCLITILNTLRILVKKIKR